MQNNNKLRAGFCTQSKIRATLDFARKIPGQQNAGPKIWAALDFESKINEGVKNFVSWAKSFDQNPVFNLRSARVLEPIIYILRISDIK